MALISSDCGRIGGGGQTLGRGGGGGDGQPAMSDAERRAMRAEAAERR